MPTTSSSARRPRAGVASLLASAVGVLALCGVAATAGAQTSDPVVINACYVPLVGAIYVVKTTNAPAKCASSHIPLNWNQTGPVGPAGAAGPQGPQGPQGPAGQGGSVTGYSQEIVTNTPVPSHDYAFVQLTCPAGKLVLGGGVSVSSAGIELVDNRPFGLNSWIVRAYNTTTSSVNMSAYAICANAVQ